MRTGKAPVFWDWVSNNPFEKTTSEVGNDMWHHGLEFNPIYPGIHLGYGIAGRYIASKGFADDCIVVSDDALHLYRLHQWSRAWSDWHQLWFHVQKTNLVGIDGKGNKMSDHDIRIRCDDGRDVVVMTGELDESIDYLGAKLQLNLTTSASVSKVRRIIFMWTTEVSRHKLRVDRAIYVFNTYMIPAISYAMTFASPDAKEAQQWDSIVCTCIAKLMGARGARQIKHEALAWLTGLVLPSQYQQMVKVSELFIRLNSDASHSWLARHRWLSSSNIKGSRMNQVVKMADALGLVFKTSSRFSIWDSSCPIASTVSKFNNISCRISYNYYGLWGLRFVEDCHRISVCTDGSAKGYDSSWAVCFMSDEFLRNYRHVPGEGKFGDDRYPWISIMNGHLSSHASKGSYDAELHAIARTLMSVGAFVPIHIHTDSQAAIKAISRALQNCRCVDEDPGKMTVRWHDDRLHLRSAGRPLLSLIVKLIMLKKKYHPRAVVTFSWVRAHTSGGGVSSVGNRCADEFAKRALSCAGNSTSSIPLGSEENFVSVHDKLNGRIITFDLRRECRQRIEQQNLAAWKGSNSQSAFSTHLLEPRTLWKTIIRVEPVLSGIVLRILANIIQWQRAEAGNSIDGKVGEAKCRWCVSEVANVGHLLLCRYMDRVQDKCVSDIVRFVKAKLPVDSVWNGTCDGKLRLPPVFALLHSLHFISHDFIDNVDASNNVLIGCGVGAFSTKLAMEGLRGLGIDDLVDRQSVVEYVRVRLVRSIKHSHIRSLR